MPIGVKILIGINEFPQPFSLPDFRKELMTAMSLTNEDFRAGGPLEMLQVIDKEALPITDTKHIWLDLNLWRAWYGVGYERGDVELFIKCAEWLEYKLPGCMIFYGHDVDDENLSLFDELARTKLLRHKASLQDSNL